ncbi:glucose-6-phosphate isomerase [Shimia marina]|uniref:Glucose-6-phosphate isomerase n=1 Tax=Shimia marina TaxID=321267 RepID=A0A0P1ET67_9RHOB|nr:glucose-6-phosphate isomerase [Shimia marina]CUH53754.1 Glucose-6-phosphate isomerase [Shimia marina]SFD69275.1 glucose-6-phosphate isomerase [Shimia marina]
MWTTLDGMRAAAQSRKIADLFAQDAERATGFAITAEGLRFDYSKTSMDAAGRTALIAQAEAAGLAQKRAAMFAGEKINETEGRAVLHTALRNLGETPVLVEGQDVLPEIRETRARMARFATSVRDGSYPGDGRRITDVVNIGIGGSDLGPLMAVLALAPYHDGPKCHFISNVDGADATDTLEGLDPHTTLVIVASKTFTTQETMMNARTALAWAGGAAALDRFVAISTAEARCAEFGIPAERVFGFEDWVGGRYSVWGPIGLSLMLAIGPTAFEGFLEGGQAMDLHFQSADFAENLPVMLALVGIWNQQVCGHGTRAVLPYEQRLTRLPAYLQQLEMESNGKGVAMDGRPLDRVAGPVVWGEPGTNGQHAFYQLIHQGQQVVPCEFLVGAEGHEPALGEHHRALVANCLAQSEALLKGRSEAEARAQLAAKGLSGDALDQLAKHRVFSGNRPSTTLVYPRLTPFVLGQLVALYEHRVFVEGVIYGINSFDQWGVELGKELAGGLLEAVASGQAPEAASESTKALLTYIRSFQS